MAASANRKGPAAVRNASAKRNRKAGSKASAQQDFNRMKKKAAADVQKLRESVGTMVGAVFCTPDGCSYSFYDE